MNNNNHINALAPILREISKRLIALEERMNKMEEKKKKESGDGSRN